MNIECCPRPILLHRPLPLRLLEAAADRFALLGRQIRAWRAERAEVRRTEQAERELARLSLRTLEDIGAPQGLIGQRRWQEEHEDAQRTFSLHQRS
jgi:uncharacterized protein YjiS (DUF1127 family)